MSNLSGWRIAVTRVGVDRLFYSKARRTLRHTTPIHFIRLKFVLGESSGTQSRSLAGARRARECYSPSHNVTFASQKSVSVSTSDGSALCWRRISPKKVTMLPNRSSNFCGGGTAGVSLRSPSTANCLKTEGVSVAKAVIARSGANPDARSNEPRSTFHCWR